MIENKTNNQVYNWCTSYLFLQAFKSQLERYSRLRAVVKTQNALGVLILS